MPKKKRKSVTLTAAQVEIVGLSNDLAFKNPKLTFEQVSLKELGRNPFLKTLNGRKSRMECKKGIR